MKPTTHARPRRSLARSSAFGLFAAATLAALAFAAPASATSIIPPGFTNTTIGIVPGSTSSFGDAVYDAAGNAYVVSRTTGTSRITRVTPAGAMSTFLSLPWASATGLALDGNRLLVSRNTGELYETDISSPFPSISFVTSLASHVSSLNDIAIAPANSPYAGDLIFGGVGGAQLGRLDLNSLLSTGFGVTNFVSALDFSPSGDLIFVGGNTLATFAGGLESQLAALPSASDALAINPVTGAVFVGSSGTDRLYTVSGGLSSVFAVGIDFDSGHFQDPLTFTPDGTSLLYAELENTAQIGRIDGFTFNTPDGGATLTLLGLGLGAFGLARRKWAGRRA